ncbi:MAG: adenosine kinase [Gemmatimonadaceae bacterium]|nr:adenosine kinase [Gemmatimonadaceae bacterium]
MSEYGVYGIGHALVDLQFAVEDSLLRELGIAKGVMTLVDEGRRREILDRLSDPVNRASGGSAANTVITVARFGGRARYAFQVGEDDWGRFYRKDLTAAGVDSNPACRIPGETGQCLVMVTPDAERSMLTFLGASGTMGPRQVDPEGIAASRFVYLEGYLLTTEVGFQACRMASAIAREVGVEVSLTLSDPSVVEAFRDRFKVLADDGVDLLFCNEEEAAVLTGVGDPQEATSRLADLSARVCVTLGAGGALTAERGSPPRLVRGVEAKAVDTTGAGDTFAGGVLYGLASGHSLKESARLGNYAAAAVVSLFGPRLETEMAPLVDEILRDRAPPPAALIT